MTAEAAVLGTPAIRFNDFVGELAYLEELEHKYQLTLGIKADNPQKLIEVTRVLVNTDNLKQVWQEKRTNMLKQSIDFSEFMISLLEK
jgi:predicted glycosyltransferase